MRVRDEGIHQPWLTADREDVYVTARFASTPQAADGNQLDVTVMDMEEVDQ